MNDTTPEMAEKMREMIRKKTPIERLKMGSAMYDASRRLIIRAIMEKNPNITPSALRQEIFLHFYSNDIDSGTRQKIVDHLGHLG